LLPDPAVTDCNASATDPCGTAAGPAKVDVGNVEASAARERHARGTRRERYCSRTLTIDPAVASIMIASPAGSGARSRSARSVVVADG
jgi:hypothetical protein